MRQAKRKEKDKVAIVLMLCFCVIALTSIFTIKSNIDKVNESSQQILVSDEAATQSSSTADIEDEAEEVAKSDASDTASNDVSTEASSPALIDSLDSNTESDTADDSSKIYIYPVSASDSFISSPFSMDALIYSVTLDQYMVHCGTDIQAEEGTNVLSIDDGIVTAIYVDDRYGNSVEITHGNNLISIYSNLSDSKMVEIGDSLSAGAVIGTVGSTGLFESMEPSHLHLEVIRDGIYVNPEEYICNTQ